MNRDIASDLAVSSVHPETAIGVFTNSFLNPKSEITSAILAANNFGYAYDPIGNRISTEDTEGNKVYSANSLNQYTQISDGVTNFPTYDLDGNLLTYNGWTFTWNGENRLIQASNATHVISYAYDYQGRMFQKVVDGVTNTLIWDGFNIIAEIAPGHTNFNVWGLDLSGTIQGAGGIGGLLAVAMPSAPCAMHFPLADGNGNITEYVATNGTVVAHREYSAFGETLALTGTKQDDFTFWFSTKPYDPLTKVSHYQRRDYWAEMGRWGSRDPLADESFTRKHAKIVAHLVAAQYQLTDQQAGQVLSDVTIAARLKASLLNLLLALENDPVAHTDYLGLKCIVYVMIGHFGRVDPDTQKIIPEGDIWDRLGSSTFNLDKDDGVLSLSCHMVSFLEAVKKKFPGTVTPSDWPPSPYKDEGVYGGDFVAISNQGDLGKAVKRVVDQLFEKPHCCEKVEARARCDAAATETFRLAKKTGTLKKADPCAEGGLTVIYNKPNPKAEETP